MYRYIQYVLVYFYVSRIFSRPQVFSPNEQLTDEILVALVFSQIVRDVFDESCQRILTRDRMKMKVKLGKS